MVQWQEMYLPSGMNCYQHRGVLELQFPSKISNTVFLLAFAVEYRKPENTYDNHKFSYFSVADVWKWHLRKYVYMLFAIVILMLNCCEWVSERIFEWPFWGRSINMAGFCVIQGYSSDPWITQCKGWKLSRKDYLKLFLSRQNQAARVNTCSYLGQGTVLMKLFASGQSRLSPIPLQATG